jgi:tRNA A37 methylthiotransferase MiaB
MLIVKNIEVAVDPFNKLTSVYVVANGCHESFVEAGLLERYFEEKPWFSVAKEVADADLVLFLGCAVHQHKEDESREIIKILDEQKSPKAELLVLGCISKVIPELAHHSARWKWLVKDINNLLCLEEKAFSLETNSPYRDYRLDRDPVENLARLRIKHRDSANSLSKALLLGNRSLSPCFDYTWSITRRYWNLFQSKIDVWNKETFSIRICTGCLGRCSYCSIKQARGEIHSKPIVAVLEEFESGLKEGFREFALIGTDIGDYGKDLGTDLIELLRALVMRDGCFHLRLRNVNPRWLIPNVDSFCSLLETGKITYLQSPLQSGSNNVLQLMDRGYKAENYIESVRKIRRSCPTIVLKTQIMVGFPGETDEDFSKSLRLFSLGLFNYIDVFRYTNRPETRAAKMCGQIPPEQIYKRYKKLLFRSVFPVVWRVLFSQVFKANFLPFNLSKLQSF